jgi:polyhydroxyalkanoate synthase
LKKLVDTQGESLRSGISMLVADALKGRISMTDESAFEIGRNVATSEGSVVFENEIIQLIQYKALTPTVHEKPLLIVPPCINKFYILDLQPENSLVRNAVNEGHTTFLISWRNPMAAQAALTWDDYIEDGIIEAIDVVRDIAKQKTIDMLGFCVGGTMLTTALAVLAARETGIDAQPAASLTLLTTLLDFSDTGILDVFVDEASVQQREKTIGGKGVDGHDGGVGLMPARDLATSFSFLRPNDLVWNYVVSNYLKGEPPPPFDLLYWNADSTNLPGPFFVWYLRNTYLENRLMQPGATTVRGVPVDLGAIKSPVFIYGSREDHIVPWPAAYASTQVLKGPKRFVLGASGHIAGVINPPSKKKRSHWTFDPPRGRFPADADAWMASATEVPGSWWTEWNAWLAGFAGKKVKARAGYGSARYKPIEPAPGRYVAVRAT